MPRAKSNKPNKSDFVRSQPASLSAAEVVAKAKAAGITISNNLVYMVRGRRSVRRSDTKGASRRTAASTRHIADEGHASATHGSHTKVESVLKAAAAELGLGRAMEILQGEREKVRAILEY